MRCLFKTIVSAVLALMPLAATAAPPASPAAVVATPRFAFQPVVEGTEVVHAFVITNKGAGMLEIAGVKTG